MIKAIIFDADGVLVKSEFLSTRLIANRGAKKEHFDEFFAGPFQRCIVGKADLKEEVKKSWHIWKWDDDLESLLEYWFHEDANQVDKRFGPFIGSLRERGIICALGTNNEKYRTHDLLNAKGLGEYIDAVFSSGLVGKKKPDQDYFEHVSGELKLTPEEIAFFDDDIENIAAAKAHGWKAFHYASFEKMQEEIKELIP